MSKSHNTLTENCHNLAPAVAPNFLCPHTNPLYVPSPPETKHTDVSGICGLGYCPCQLFHLECLLLPPLAVKNTAYLIRPCPSASKHQDGQALSCLHAHPEFFQHMPTLLYQILSSKGTRNGPIDKFIFNFTSPRGAGTGPQKVRPGCPAFPCLISSPRTQDTQTLQPNRSQKRCMFYSKIDPFLSRNTASTQNIAQFCSSEYFA